MVMAAHLPSEYLFDKINITRQGDFGMYTLSELLSTGSRKQNSYTKTSWYTRMARSLRNLATLLIIKLKSQCERLIKRSIIHL